MMKEDLLVLQLVIAKIKKGIPNWDAFVLRRVIVIILFFNSILIQAQNLVVNPSFEITETDELFRTYPKGWQTVGGSSSYSFINTKLAHPMAAPTKIFFIDNWGLGNLYYQERHTGKALVGLFLYRHDSVFTYLSSQFEKKLQKDSLYYIEFFCYPSDNNSKGTSDIGIYFSEQTLNPLKKIKPLFLEPHVKANQIIPEGQWTKVYGLYKAIGDENFITIGNFTSNHPTVEKLNREKLQNIPEMCIFMLIDDVLVMKVSEYVANLIKNLESDKKLIINDINFELNSSKINKESTIYLDFMFQIMVIKSDLKLKITGHTDNAGTDTYNLKLSKTRANVVMQYLTDKGIESTRMQSDGLGATSPIDTNETPAGKAKNRRVEFEIFY